MMNKRGFLIWLLACLPILAFAQTKTQDCLPIRTIPPAQVAFSDGETFTVIGSYKWGVINTDVGTVDFTLKKEGDYFFAQGEIRTARFFNSFYKVQDHYESRFHSSNMRPVHFMRDIHEAKYTIENHYTWNSDNSINAHIVRKSGIQDTILPARECTFDFVTLFYFLRCLNFDAMEIGHISPISFAVDDDVFDLYLRYEGKEEKKVQGLGTFRCLKFAAQTVAGVVFDGTQELVFWLSDDKNHLPIGVESPLVIGRVSARLGSYGNLRFPLTSKIK